MDDVAVPNRANLGWAAMELLMAAGLRRSLAATRVDPNDIARSSLESPTVFLVFLERHPVLADEFLRRMGVDRASVEAALKTSRLAEAPPDPPRLPENPTDEQREVYEFYREMDEERRAKGEAAPFSGPIKRAQQASRTAATAAGESRAPLGRLVAALIEVDSNARAAILEVAAPTRLAEALDWLRGQPDPPEKDRRENQEAHQERFREIQEAAYAGVRAKQEAAMSDEARRKRDEAYERNPERYETPVDVADELAKAPLLPQRAYLWRTGVCRRAAENEARLRHAPEATLDHLLVALLRDGTDTADFLDARDVDRAEWSSRLDTALPRFDEGPRWPPLDRALGMGLPDNKALRLKKALPEGLRLADLSDEQMREYVEVGRDEERRFTDLIFTERFANEPMTIGYRLFAEAEISFDRLKADRIGRERNDPDWWRRPPDLIANLREVERTSPIPDMARGGAYGEAALYRARMRRAPTIELDDLLVALLVPGTDLWNLVQNLGHDPSNVRAEVEDLQPRFAEGPIFPEDDSIRMRLLSLTKQGFSDLLFLCFEPWDETKSSPGLEHLRARGVTQEAIDARLDALGVVRYR